MTSKFIRPIDILYDQNRFGDREVGITHTETAAYLKMADSGDIECMAAEGLGFIMHPQNRSITFVADSIRFVTKEQDGLRWNKLSFNPQATSYTEPAFVTLDEDEMINLYKGSEDYV